MFPTFSLVIDARDTEHRVNVATIARAYATGGTINKLRVVAVELTSGGTIEVLASGKTDGEAVRNCLAGIHATTITTQNTSSDYAEIALAAIRILDGLTSLDSIEFGAKDVRDIALNSPRFISDEDRATLIRYADNLDAGGRS